MRPSWLEYHFPAIAERGTVVYYSDVVGMAPREADSVRDLLATQIRYGRKRVWKRKASRVGLLRDAEDDLDDDWSIRLKQLEEALTDLCEAYSLGNPL